MYAVWLGRPFDAAGSNPGRTQWQPIGDRPGKYHATMACHSWFLPVGTILGAAPGADSASVEVRWIRPRASFRVLGERSEIVALTRLELAAERGASDAPRDQE